MALMWPLWAGKASTTAATSKAPDLKTTLRSDCSRSASSEAESKESDSLK